jgi:hypothetical protein
MASERNMFIKFFLDLWFAHICIEKDHYLLDWGSLI